jgi:hypothetical protein
MNDSDASFTVCELKASVADSASGILCPNISPESDNALSTDMSPGLEEETSLDGGDPLLATNVLVVYMCIILLSITSLEHAM